MHNHRFLFFMLLAGYIFTPTLLNWIMTPSGLWYKPYIIWFLIIVGAYALQKYNQQS